MKAGYGNVGAKYQAVLFSISLLLLTLIVFLRFHMFIAHDPPIQLRQSDSKKLVTVGLHVNSFSTFDVVKNMFVLEGIVWFAYDPLQVHIDQIKQFDVVHGELIHKSDPTITTQKGEEIAQFGVRIQFNTFLDYRSFPMDDHNVRLTITNHFLPDGVLFTSADNDITLEQYLYLPGWNITNISAQAGLGFVDLVRGKQQLGIEYPQTVISFSCERTDPNIVVNILLTLILILFMSLLTFSSNEDSVLVVSVIIVALISYRAVMLSLGPSNISYFMLSDYLYLISLSASVLTLLAGIFAHEEKLTIHTKKIFIALIYLYFVGGCSLISFIL